MSRRPLTPRTRLRWLALAEGLSYVVLLFVAMPLKYGVDWPWAVRYVGWAHGVLFVAYGAAALHALLYYRWRFERALYLATAALVPFVSFALERTLRREENEEITDI